MDNQIEEKAYNIQEMGTNALYNLLMIPSLSLSVSYLSFSLAKVCFRNIHCFTENILLQVALHFLKCHKKMQYLGTVWGKKMSKFAYNQYISACKLPNTIMLF